MTYGWVILVLIVALVVMWQWGLFNLSSSVDPGSFGFWGLVITDGTEFQLIQNGLLRVSVLNTVGANVSLLYYNATYNGVSVDCGACAEQVIEPGENVIVSLQSSNWASRPRTRYEVHLLLRYNDSRTGDHIYQSSGTLWGNVEL